MHEELFIGTSGICRHLWRCGEPIVGSNLVPEMSLLSLRQQGIEGFSLSPCFILLIPIKLNTNPASPSWLDF